RRLGKSLGINNIPFKTCSYSCSYCQLGKSITMSITRSDFHDPKQIVLEVQNKLKALQDHGETIDYISFVPDGEPTLDSNLGTTISLLKKFELPIAVITNSSLMGELDVRNELFEADWVSVKVDSVREDTWRKVDHPHRSLSLPSILEGITEFASIYEGILVTETMVVKDGNDDDENAQETASFLCKIQPAFSYISIPTRPPADTSVKPPDESSLNRIYQIFTSMGIRTEYLIGYEGNEFAFSGNAAEDILSITAVHPMREDAILEFLQKSGSSFKTIEDLLEKNLLVKNEYNEKFFYSRKFPKQ
ncbi:MAG: radical SAM protein, partial [Caldisericia bacterium]|nr:radical SAM protein [Caldisericia bacterium]